MARTDIWNTDEEYETEGQSLPHGQGFYGGYKKPGDIGEVDTLADPDIQRMIKSWGVPDPRTLHEAPPSEKEFAPPDPDDEMKVAGDPPTTKEAYDRWRQERLFAQDNTDDLRWAFMVKQYEKRPEWKVFLDELGEQSRTMSNRLLLQAFNAWNEDRTSSKPDWLNENPQASDTKSLNEQFPPDDRNEAMGPAPEGKFKIPTRVSNAGGA